MVLKQKPARKQGAPNRCCHRTIPTVIRILFDDHRLVANAGLLLPATLARHLGLRELVDHHLDLGGAPGRANTGDKMLTLVASALAGGDCIDDADALRAGGTVGVLGCVVKAPSTLGTFLRSFRWEHVRQLDRVSRQFAPWPGCKPFYSRPDGQPATDPTSPQSPARFCDPSSAGVLGPAVGASEAIRPAPRRRPGPGASMRRAALGTPAQVLRSQLRRRPGASGVQFTLR